MGVLDQFGGAVGSVLGQGKGAGVSAVLLQQLIAMLSKPGALGELTSKFQSAGLGNILQSWIGSGQNLPISADQVSKVLGAGTVADLAKKAGIGERETTERPGEPAAAGHRQGFPGRQGAGGERSRRRTRIARQAPRLKRPPAAMR